MQYIIGADLGTSACKTVLMNESGELIASVTEEYALDYSCLNWVEFDCTKLYQAFIQTCRQCIVMAGIKSKEIAAIGLSGQMVSFIGLDEFGEPVRPMISWMDHRNHAEVNDLRNDIGEHLYEITLNPLNTTFTLPKMLWVKKHEPDVWKKVKKVVLSKDYVRYRLTGVYATDHTDASSTLIYDLKKADWSDEILAQYKIPRGLMPDIHYSCEITGTITQKASEQTGLPQGIPVVAGGGDTGCENFSAGIMQEGQCLMRLGTGATIAIPITEPPVKQNNTCPLSGYYKKNIWLLQGVSQSFGQAMRWARDTLGKEEILFAKKTGSDAYDLICNKASESPIGSKGLVFHPFITGAPYWNEHMQGGFLCITSAHGHADFLRAVMEGATCALNDAMKVLENLSGKTIERCILTGGAKKSAFWVQMIANILHKKLVIIPDADACTGAAYMAGIGIGMFPPDYTQKIQTNSDRKLILPDDDKNNYAQVYEKYTKVHNGLSGFYKDLY